VGREAAEKAQVGVYSDPDMSLLTVIINIRKASRIPLLALYLMLCVSALLILQRPELCSKNASVCPWFVEALSS